MDKKRGMAIFVIGVIILIGQGKLFPLLYSVALIPFQRLDYQTNTGNYINLVSILSVTLPTFSSILVISGVVIFCRARKEGSAKTSTL